MYQKGIVHIIGIVIGLLIVAILIGFFTASNLSMDEQTTQFNIKNN